MNDSLLNQPDLRGDRDLFQGDVLLRSFINDTQVADFGATLGTVEMREHGRLANRYPPELRQFDRGGRRLDLVDFHPSYHRFLQLGLAAGYAAAPWEKNSGGGHLSHAAMVYLQSQVEPGAACPMTMTYAAYPSLTGQFAGLWREKITSREYDPRPRSFGKKKGLTLGMAMTEKQGGSDLRSNTTRAERDGDAYRLFGHKWFCSAPMSDGFLTLAQAPGGLTCFLVPRWLPDGTTNQINLMRLKEKMGNRSNASAEIEYHGAWAEQLGEQGDGIRQIIRMVHHTRLDTAMAPAGLMRAALEEAHHWCTHRTVFQKRLIDQPLMRGVLADLALDWEGATLLGFHVACAMDEGAPLARIAVALAKFLSNKLCPNVVYEAMECLGGMGYTDDTPMPMLFRESPLNSIWEGSGNVICLDILRSYSRDPQSAEALTQELEQADGADRRFDAARTEFLTRWGGAVSEEDARLFTEQAATLLTASILLRKAPTAVADAYVATRVVAGARGRIAGAVSGLDTAAIVSRLGE